MSTVQEYISENTERFQQLLADFISIPSVSAQSQHFSDAIRATEWLKQRFLDIGFNVKIYETPGHPVVYAQSPYLKDAPTILVYGHYDVQPAVKDNLWNTDPFTPVIRDGYIYGRGASDDKGQILAHILSAEAWVKSGLPLSVNLKFIIEGDEEGGTDAMNTFVLANTQLLACDCLVISDTPQYAPGQPAICCGLRGIIYYEIQLKGPDRDLHSGMFGGAITNPCNALCKMLASLINQDGIIQVPGFYDDVIRPDMIFQEQLASLKFNEEQFYSSVGVKTGSGEKGFTPLERRWTRPALDIHGIWGGYQGEGDKTVLPAEAHAKFSFRIVAHQDAKKISAALRDFLSALCPPGIKMTLNETHAGKGVLIDNSSIYMQAAVNSIEFGFGRSPVFIREGGSIPIVSVFHENITPHILLLGFSQDTDNAHGPNEKFSLSDFHRGIRTSARLWKELAAIVR